MTQLLPPIVTPERAPRVIGFVETLAEHGARRAIIDEHGTAVSYAELDRRVRSFARRLGPARRLTMAQVDNTLDSIVGYLGALRAGHAVILVGDDAGGIVEHHDPDVIIAGTSIERERVETRHRLHADLALLLSTSGSTGSPKLVRLSHDNVASNATAIARSLSLDVEDRAVTTLPLHYCFGLSILHSHLTVGASLALSPHSVVDPCFWATVERTEPTILAAVPHTIELLDRVGFADRAPTSLRALLQAGGRLAPDDVRRYAAAGQEAGWDLFVMYGQTEATARMAYLPPELALQRPDAVGRAVDGGSFDIVPFDGCADGTGEVVYTGPNVMMGYADVPADLAKDRELTRLATGDVGRLADDGLLEIVGRRSDFLKLYGLRIDLERVRSMLDDAGIEARVDGDDDGIVVALADGDPGSAATLITDRLGLPRAAVAAAVVHEVPRLANGKVDRATLRASVRSDRMPGRDDRDVRSVFAQCLGRDEVDAGDTFVGLGGDSLSYVEVSIALERVLGHLPDAWHLETVAALEAAAGTEVRRTPRVETNVVLRAVAIVLIVGNHTGLFLVPGGAHVLFAGAGFNFARFQVGDASRWRSVLRLAVPAVVWIGGAAALRDDFGAAHALLVHGWLDGTGRWMYWFVEALVQVLLVLAIVFSVPAVRRAERRAPFSFAVGLLALTSLPAFDLVDIGALGDLHRSSYRPHEIAWLFALGWAMARATDPMHRIGLSAFTLLAVPAYFGDTTRTVVVVVGMLALAWVSRVPVPRPVNGLVGVVASASLYIYLTHVQIHPLFDPPALAVLASLLFGVAAWKSVTRVTAAVPSPRR